jgi:hypothetical protein
MDVLALLWLLTHTPDAIRQKGQVGRILLPLSSQVPSPERGENGLYATRYLQNLGNELMMSYTRLRTQTASDAGKKQVVSPRQRTREIAC